MVEYCQKCSRVKIVSFCPRCENMFGVSKGREEILCNKCRLMVKLCLCKNTGMITGP